MGYNVAVDGPAGAGKSTIAKLVAKEKGYSKTACKGTFFYICRYRSNV